MRRTALHCSIAIVLAAPATALAQQQPVPAPATPVQTALTLGLERIGSQATVLVGDRIRVRGTVGTFVPGEAITVRFHSDGKKVLAKRRMLVPGPNGSGHFEFSYRAQRSGRLKVTAYHDATPALGGLAAKARRTVEVLPRSVGSHSNKRAVRALQRRLARLGYVVGHRGSFDARTARAVLAFRKVTGMRRTTEASRNVMRRIARGRGAFKIRRPDHGRHIEADLTRQVIALIDGGKVRRIYPISSGAPGTPTVLGSFRVYSKTPGTNAKGMVDSAYFIRGYATHGYPSVPIYPASHGCLRVPIPDARSLFNWITIGTPVDVYYGPKPK
jgi:peptidoglycan hydrolase-like protein with peptidoglycan-binding domain